MSGPFIHPLTPTGPSFRVDWKSIREAFSWVQDMVGVKQEPRHHAEGDVDVHTRMVCEALAADPEWQSLDEEKRNILFVSAMLHDVGKPATTILEDGRWTSPRHAIVGAFMSRCLLWRGLAGPVPHFKVREEITWLVRYHGLPLRFVDKGNPERAVNTASLGGSHRLLHMLSRADVVGRINSEPEDLRHRLGLFEDYCKNDLDCWEHPAKFLNDHHRFMYCVGSKDWSYVPFDDFSNQIVVMCGLPGMGKSTVSKKEGERLSEASGKETTIIRLDDIREELGIDPADRGGQGPVINRGHELLRTALREKRPAVWDATNVTRDHRSILVATAGKYNAKTKIVYVEVDRLEGLRRNRSRERVVPESAINEMMDKLEVPLSAEAHGCEYHINGEVL